MKYWESGDYLFFGFIGLMVLSLVAVLSTEAYDGWLDRQSFGAQVACETARMQPRRQWLSTEVVCVPDARRRDTTTVQVR